MGRTLGILFFAVSLSAAAQVIVQGGYATQNPTGNVILAPPNAALPGSGTPMGAPLDINANNARINATGAVYTPDTRVETGGLRTSGAATNSASTAAAPAGAASAPQGGTASAVFGIMTRFIPDQSRPNASRAAAAPSLGEIAAQYRKGKAAPVDRRLDNTDVLALNNTATFRGQTVELPQSDQPPVDENGNPIGTARSDDQQDQRVLDKNDLRDVENAVQRSKERQKQQAQPQPEQPR